MEAATKGNMEHHKQHLNMENPFEQIFEQMNRMESMIHELKQQLNTQEETSNGIELAMRITGYKRNTIYKLVNLRQIPHYKHRGFLRFKEQELKQWAEGKKRLTS